MNIQIEVPADASLESACHEAIDKAVLHDCGVEFTWGAIPMVAYARDEVQTLVDEWARKDRLRRDMSVLRNGQVARICHVSVGTSKRWFDQGLLRGFRIPGSQDRRVLVSALADFMSKNGMPLAWLEAFEAEGP